MKAKIHVNQHIIKRNQKLGLNDPPITVKTYKQNHRCRAVHIQGPSRVTGTHDGQNPLSCGATVWIEADFKDLVLS